MSLTHSTAEQRCGTLPVHELREFGCTCTSGDLTREQGISKAGSRYLRALAIELAWSWVRRQPQSDLSQWYRRRYALGGARLRRIGIVAVARKLLIALWRYLETGQVPAGALMKA